MTAELEPAPSLPRDLGRLATPAGTGRWVDIEERRLLSPPATARLALERAIGKESGSMPFVRAWLNEIESVNTRTAYSLDVLALVDWIREKHGNPDEPLDLSQIGRGVIAEWAEHMRDTPSARTGRKLAAATRSRRLAAASSMFGYLVENDIADRNPARDVRRPPVSREGKTQARTAADIDALVNACWSSKFAARDTALVGVLAATALRIGEVLAADVRDLRLESAQWVLHVTLKGGKFKRVQLDPDVVLLLHAHTEGRPETDPLILDNEGGRMNWDQAQRALERLSTAAKVQVFTAHQLRTSALTDLLDAGVPLVDVQYVAGHAHPDTTGRYHRRSNGDATGRLLVAKLAARLPSLHATGEEPRTDA